jgi:hypothetical protein
MPIRDHHTAAMPSEDAIQMWKRSPPEAFLVANLI